MKKAVGVIILLALVWNSCSLIRSDNPRYHNLKKVPLASVENKDSFQENKFLPYIFKDTMVSFVENSPINEHKNISQTFTPHSKEFFTYSKSITFKPSFAFPKLRNLAIAPKSTVNSSDDIVTLLIYILIIALILTLISLILPQFVEILIAVFLIALLILLILY
ncbi:MAG: hypothetical protein N2Z72_02720, partial [Bacteroidales bacterium]|nr:hypothetical protein [Bacteroidales bacterium]